MSEILPSSREARGGRRWPSRWQGTRCQTPAIKEIARWDFSACSSVTTTPPVRSAINTSRASWARTSSVRSTATGPASGAAAADGGCSTVALARVVADSSAVAARETARFDLRRRPASDATAAGGFDRARSAAVARVPASSSLRSIGHVSAARRRGGRSWSAASARDPATSPWLAASVAVPAGTSSDPTSDPDERECPRVPMDAHGCPRMPMDAHGCPRCRAHIP